MNRTDEVRRLRATGMSYGRIAAALKMSKRDVSKILSGTSTITVPTPDGTKAVPTTLAVPSTVPVPGGTNDELARTLRRLKWAMDDSEKVLLEMSALPHQIANVLGPLRLIANDLCKQYPVAKVTPVFNVQVVDIDPLTIDPLASISSITNFAAE